MDRTMRRHINIIALLAIIILSGCKREDDLIPVAKISFKDSYTAEFTSVTLNCDVKSNVTIETLHVEYSVSEDMSESQQIEMSVTKDNTYSATIPNLSIQTEYYYRFVVGNKVSEFFDDQKRTFKTLDYIAPVVHTEDASSISGTKATLKGVVEFACEKPILEQGFMVGTQEDNLETYKVDGTDFTFNIENLNYKTTYYYRAYAKNDVGIGLGEIKTFQTCGAVSFNEIKLLSVTANSAMIEAGVADNGGIEVDIQGIRYCVKGNDEVTFVETIASTTLKNLKHDTTYEVWGYAKTFEGEFEGDRVEFNTMDGKVLITTSSPSNVTTSSATLKGSITSDGGSKIIERGFCYSTKDIPTLSDIKIKVTGETGAFESELTNLPQNVQYSVRAYAINGIDTYYGEVVSFTTLYDSATFGTITSSDITASSVSLKCSITSNGGSAITKCGFCYSTYKNPTIDDQIAVVSDSKTNLNATIKGLKSGITYYVRAFATNANSTFYSGEISFITSEGIIQFTDPSTENIAAASVIVSSNILTAGGGTITERGFCYSIAKNPTTENNTVRSSGTLGEYSATITNLQNKTIYYIRAYAINESGTYYSKEITVKTLDGVASVITSEATNIMAQSATLNGNIASDGGSNITERGFCYSTSENPTVDATIIKIDGATGEISHNLTGLTHTTRYYVRCYAKNTYGIHYGNQISFTTSSGVVAFEEITTSSITTGTVQLATQISSDGNSPITKRGFCYSTSANPTIVDNIITISGTTGDLSGKITGLTNGVRYYVRAFATNAIGTHYSVQTEFTTLTGLADVTTSAVTDVMAESVILNGDIQSANGGTITSRGFCYSTSENPTINSNKVTVAGTTGQMSKSVANLEENTKYYVRAFATTSFGSTYGQQVTFTTKDGVIIFSGFKCSDILANSVLANVTIETNGGSLVTERGFCISTSANPTISNTKVLVNSANNSYYEVIQNLTRSTHYYIRAYGKNNIGTYYSSEIKISTQSGAAVLSELKNDSIGQTTLGVSCSISSNGGTEILRKGFCYSTTPDPTVASERVILSGDDNFIATISDLISDQDYYIKAFAETKYETTYSNEVCIRTIAGIATLGQTSTHNITPTSVILRSSIVSNGGTDIIAQGFCYGKNEHPTINNNIVNADSYLSEFSSKLEGLEQNTTYYVRSYATTQYGTSYGHETYFKTTYYPIEFSGIEVSSVLLKTASVTSTITTDGANGIDECGFCVSTDSNPTIDNLKFTETPNVGDISCEIRGLNHSSTYYIRPYAKNEMGVFYGDETQFNTINLPDGAAPGLFLLSKEGQYCYMAKGDLEKNDDNASWNFAEDQLKNTENHSTKFNYGTSGYTPIPRDLSGLTGNNSNYDWGVYNSINNGGGNPGLWRTPTVYEFRFIIKERSNASALRAIVTINNVLGMILLPDDWCCPNELNHIITDSGFKTDNITLSEWKILESLGAIFLKHDPINCSYHPYGGGGCKDTWDNVTVYWTSTGYYSGGNWDDFYGGYAISFTKENIIYYDGVFDYKYHVRLIKDL